jgi:hypothetical protein
VITTSSPASTASRRAEKGCHPGDSGLPATRQRRRIQINTPA